MQDFLPPNFPENEETILRLAIFTGNLCRGSLEAATLLTKYHLGGVELSMNFIRKQPYRMSSEVDRRICVVEHRHCQLTTSKDSRSTDDTTIFTFNSYDCII